MQYLAARFYPANFPRALPFMVVQRRVGNSLTCPDGPLLFTRIRLTALPKLSPPAGGRPAYLNGRCRGHFFTRSSLSCWRGFLRRAGKYGTFKGNGTTTWAPSTWMADQLPPLRRSSAAWSEFRQQVPAAHLRLAQ